MNDEHMKEHAREREAAREREFDALLEQELGDGPPVDAILARAYGDAARARPARARRWLAAALMLLGVGVIVALAWQARTDRDDHDAAAPQDPSAPVELRWPDGMRRVYRPEQLADVPRDATMLSLAMPVYQAGDLAEFAELRQLDVRLTVKTVGGIMRDGEPADGERLEPLATATKLRRLSLDFLPLGPADLEVLRHLRQLEVLELNGLIVIDQALRAAAAKGGSVPTRPFDRELATAFATHSRATTLRIAGMPLTAAGARALADADLKALILEVTEEMTPDDLAAIGDVHTLRHLEIRSAHGSSVAPAFGGMITRVGAPALTTAALRRIAALPSLESLTLDACCLDAAAIAALPRGLTRLDLSGSFGVDAGIADVVADMSALQELGLPLTMANAEDYRGMRRPPIHGTDLHTRRLAGAVAARILASRPWRALRLDGQLTGDVVDALSDQPALRALTLTPTDGSEPLSFVAKLPKLERVTFVEADLAEEQVRALNGCASLRTVVFEDCSRGSEIGAPRGQLREGIEEHRATRVVR